MQIRTYNAKTVCHSEPAELRFYVLSKGNNSGRPSATPCPNCFIVTADTPETKETLYWLTYAMWKGRAFRPFLKGSVIPFITIHDYRQQLTGALRNACLSEPAELQKAVLVLRQLDDQEALATERIKTISQVRQLITRKIIKL